MTDPFWRLDPSITFLNHGSFGATPGPVRAAQDAIRDRMEAEPVRFFLREYEPLLHQARQAIALLVGAAPENLVFVTNATTGVSAVVAGWQLRPGDEVLALDHGYPACLNALRVACQRSGATLRLATLPCPIESPSQAIDAILAATTEHTRYCLLDAITSPSAIVLPVAEIVAALFAQGIETLVDAAHGPGMIPMAIEATGAAWTTANLHKWLCAPKGAAILHVRADLHHRVDPNVVSHGFFGPRPDLPRLWQAFDWPGTFDPSPWLAVPAALEAVTVTDPGGWPERMERNHALALAMRERLCALPHARPVAPPAMVGSMAAVVFDPAIAAALATVPGEATPGVHPLQQWLWQGHAIEVPVIPQPSGGLVVRASAQRYNSVEQVDRLVAALREAMALVGVAP